MSDLMHDEKYTELIKALQLRDIVTKKTFFERNIPSSEFAKVRTLSLNLERGEIEPMFSKEQVIVPIAYRVIGQAKQSDAENHFDVFHYEIVLEAVFACSDMDLLKELLSIVSVREVFLGYQMDKFVWPYLRCSFANACSALGKKSFVLPMLV